MDVLTVEVPKHGDETAMHGAPGGYAAASEIREFLHFVTLRFTSVEMTHQLRKATAGSSASLRNDKVEGD